MQNTFKKKKQRFLTIAAFYQSVPFKRDLFNTGGCYGNAVGECNRVTHNGAQQKTGKDVTSRK